MTDKRTTELTEQTSLADADLVEHVDVSDTTDAATGTNKRITGANLATYVGTKLTSTFQPLDSDLTAVAALSPSNDDVLQRKAGAWTNRTIAQLLTDLGLGALYQPLDSDLTAIAALSTTSFGRALLALADVAALRTYAQLVPGTDVQAYDAELAAIAGLTSAADRVPYFTGSGTAALATFTTAGRALVDDADAAAQWVTLGGDAASCAAAQTVNAQTGTTYTLAASDAGKLVTLSNGSAITLTVPQDSDATIAVGVVVDGYQLGAGQVTVAAGTGATLRVSGLTAKARAQYARFAVQKVSANTWSLFGDLAAS